MKAFLASIALLVVICVAVSFYFNATPWSSADVYSTESVRLN